MSKEQIKVEDYIAQQLVLIHDPILGSRYELAPLVIHVEIEIDESI